MAKKKKPKKKKIQKILMRTHEGQWLEWAAWHFGPISTTAPDTHIGWTIVDDKEVTQDPWTEKYTRWVKLEADADPSDLF